MRIIFLLLGLIWISGCVSNKSSVNNADTNKYIERISIDEFGSEDAEQIFNKSRDHVILLKKIDRGPGFPHVAEIVVLDLKAKRVIYKESVIGGRVTWQDDDIIKIKRTPDARSKDQEENEKSAFKQIDVRKL